MALDLRPLLPEEAPLLAEVDAVQAFGDPRLAAWAHGASPRRSRRWVAVDDEGVAALYGALPQKVWALGKETCFDLVVESWVRPDRRRGLQHPGLLVRTARAYFEAHRDDASILYGVPDRATWRLGKECLEYELVRTHGELVRVCDRGVTEAPAGVEEVTRFDEQARWLWERCCGAWPASTIRDEAWLRWRVLEHPDQPYTVLGVRDAEGVLRGLAIVREGAPRLAMDELILCEWLVPVEEPDVAELLLRAVLARARAAKLRAVRTIFVEWSPWFETFQRFGFRVHAGDWAMGSRAFRRRMDPLWLRDHWWYQLLDTDLV